MVSFLQAPHHIYLLCAFSVALSVQAVAEEKQPNQSNPQTNTVAPKANASEPKPNNPTSTAANDKAIVLDKVEVKGKKSRIVTPLPGLIIDKGLSTTNIQSATGKEIAESKALNVTEFMNSQMQSVSLVDYNGNPFQQDLNFRGFTASPSIGTPQGISVYLDGVRVNEAFGEVMNWDMLPMNAIASLDLIPGSNPMFGLNTLGGALALRTKDGFTDAHLRAQLLGGAWGREQAQFSNGFNVGGFGFFTAYNHFQEDGWRDNSASNLRQIFNKATVRLPLGEINFSVLNVDSDLTGNGLIPYETAAIDRKSVYTSPDGVKNQLAHYNLSGRLDVSDTMTVSGLAYRRNLDQSSLGGDINQAYARTISTMGGTGDLALDTAVESLNGNLNFSESKQRSDGAALQMAWDVGNHQMVAGVTQDGNDVRFKQYQALATIDAQHRVSLNTDPALIAADYGNIVTFPGVIRNNLSGESRTKSIFFSDTWSPIDELHVTYGARLNWSNTKNTLISDRGKELYNFEPTVFAPLAQRCLRRVGTNDPYDTRYPLEFSGTYANNSRFVCSKGDFDYRSFNPSFGVAWDAKENLTAYGNLSRGARTPTVIELGCARDREAEKRDKSTNFQFGCSIPTALSSDPYLKQVRSTAYEAGFRGLDYGFDWNFGVFRTDLKDDILFVPLGRKNRGVFDNFGETRRQGIEMGLKGDVGKSTVSFNYTFMRATFESDAQIINSANSTNTQTSTTQAYVNVKPGDQLPGMPNHIVQANWNYRFTDRFDATLGMILHSSSYVRGNENNQHRARAATNPGGLPGSDAYDFIGDGKVSGYAVFSLMANYQFDHGISIFAKVDNLFDREYANGGDLGLNPFTANGVFQADTTVYINTTFIAPGAPRAAWIGLNFDLDWKKLKSVEAKK